MKLIWWHFWRNIFHIGFLFFFRKFKTVGYKNIPRKGAVIFLPNHQNAFLDAIITAIAARRIMHFMTRADVFKKKTFGTWFMKSLNLEPIFRLRDGMDSLEKNEQVFQRCFSFLQKKEAILIHPEGNHAQQYRLRSISKGFTRIVFGYLAKYPDEDIQMVPVGLNYSNHYLYRADVEVHFAKPFSARAFYDPKNEAESARKLREAVANGIKENIVHIDDKEEYSKIYQKTLETGADFSNPKETQKVVDKIAEKDGISNANFTTETHTEKAMKPNPVEVLFYPFIYINNILPIFVYKKLKPKIKDKGFLTSIKYGVAILAGPLSYVLIFALLWIFMNFWIALIYLILSVLTGRILRSGQMNHLNVVQNS